MHKWPEFAIKDVLVEAWPGEWGSDPDFKLNPTVVFRSTDLDDHGHLDENSGVYRNIPSGKIARKKLQPGDILLEASGGTPGRPVGRVAEYLGSRNELALCANFLRVLRPSKRINSTFLKWFLHYFHGQPEIWKFQQQTTGMINLNVTQFLNHKIPVPPFHLQLNISQIISALDDSIIAIEHQIGKQRMVHQGLMNDLFTRGLSPDGHLRPPFIDSPNLYRESALGMIPKEWRSNKLGEILKKNGGYLQTGPFGSQLHSDEYQHEGVPVVMPQDINDGVIGTDYIAKITPRRSEDLSKHRMRLGDIVIARRGDLSKAAPISKREQDWICGTGCFLLRLGHSSLNHHFTSYAYQQPYIQRQIAATAVGTTMPSLNNSIMSDLIFPECDLSEQRRIVSILQDMEKNILSLFGRVSLGKQLKAGLMNDILRDQRIAGV